MTKRWLFCDLSLAFCCSLIHRWLVSLPVTVGKCKWHECCVTSNSRSKTPLNWEQCTALTHKSSKQCLLRRWHMEKKIFLKNTRRFPTWCFSRVHMILNVAAKSQTEMRSCPEDQDASRWSSELRSPQPLHNRAVDFLCGMKECSCARHDRTPLRPRFCYTHCVTAVRQRWRHRAITSPTRYWWRAPFCIVCHKSLSGPEHELTSAYICTLEWVSLDTRVQFSKDFTS